MKTSAFSTQQLDGNGRLAILQVGGDQAPCLYFARGGIEVFERNGSLLAVTEFAKPEENETVMKELVRFRTIGDATYYGDRKVFASDLDEDVVKSLLPVLPSGALAPMTKGLKRLWKTVRSRAISNTLHCKMTQDTKNYLNMDLLRFSTAGSVDDGKSTLIGRLFHDTKAIFEDQLKAIEKTSKQRGDENLNLALLTDGLRAEREQGITIDAAYRYFATPRRKFIIADTPGHIQYTRNMVTGASTANSALILRDARHGVVEQTRRHAFIADLLGIKHVAVCINKMDLVGYEEEAYGKVLQQFMEFSSRLENLTELTFIPISALKGDNAVDRSENMDWYKDLRFYITWKTLTLDRMPIILMLAFRFNGSYVPHSDKHHDFRGFAGRVAEGSSRPVMTPSFCHRVSRRKSRKSSWLTKSCRKAFILGGYHSS